MTIQADPSSFALNVNQASLSDPQSDFIRVENFFEKGFRFVINATKLDNYDIETPEFFLSNDKVSWKVLLTKRTSSFDNETVLAVSLISIFAENLTNQMYKVNAILKLLNKNQQVAVIKMISDGKFSNVKPQHEFGEISDWNGFFDQHVNEDEATFECAISIEPHFEREFELTSAKFQFLIEQLSQLRNSSTSEFQVGDIEWRIFVERQQNSLGIFLCAEPDDLHLSLFWTVEGTSQILSLHKNLIPTFRQFNFIFHRRDLCHGFKQFIDWRELIDPRNEYVVNDAAIFQIDLRVLPPKPLWN